MSQGNNSKNPNTIVFARIFTMLLILGLACVAYYSLTGLNLQHSALMFIGLPAVLAIALALTPSAKSITGGILKGITLALLISIMFLGEGVICVLMAAPLFYLIGVSIGAVIDKNKKKKETNLSAVLLPALLLASSLEGVSDDFSFSRENTVSIEKIINSNPKDIERKLSKTPAFTTDLPLFLQLGFPVPSDAEGIGIAIGNQRTINFKMKNKPEAAMTFQVVSRTPNSVTFTLIEDKTKIASWLTWHNSTVTWKAVDNNQTRVTWTLSYRRDLDPYWYFSPLMQYTIGQTAEYLIDELATPDD